MASEERETNANDQGGTHAAPVKPRQEKSPQQPAPRQLPPWKVLLHNDDVNEMGRVVRTIRQLTSLSKEDAVARTLEAHESGVALLLVTHQERAELHVEQFASFNMTVTAEPEG